MYLRARIKTERVYYNSKAKYKQITIMTVS